MRALYPAVGLMLALVLAAAAAVPRLLGGYTVLRGSDRLHVAMGFAAGGLLGVAAFETLPEAHELAGGRVAVVAGLALLGALLIAVLERYAFGHLHTEDRACNPRAGHIGAGGITTHAFIDGLAIGSAFQAEAALGLLVSAAVLLHAFSDGLNTVTVVLRHGHGRRKAVGWLLADAAAPVAGAALGLLVTLPEAALGGVLALFAGMFVYMGAGSLLPEAHRSGRDRLLVVVATAAGAGLAFGASLLA